MNIRRPCMTVIHGLRQIPLSAAVMALGLSLAVWSLVTPPAGALSNAQQLLSGGTSTVGGSTVWGAPGMQNSFGNDFPAAGKGEQATQIRMTGGGVLRSLWVRVVTETVPSSGSLTMMVRINGADTALTCTLAGAGQCQSGAAIVNVPNGARLAVRQVNNFVGAGFLTFNYTMILD